MSRRFVVPAIVVLAAVAFWLRPERTTGPITIPAVAWRVVNAADGTFRQGRNYDDLAPDTPFRLQFRCDEPRHVYVFSHSIEDGTLLLFPSPQVKSSLAQPLPPGDHVLPGQRDGKDLTWHSRRQVSATTVLLVVASRQPIAALDALLPGLRRWTNTARTDGTMEVMNPPQGEVQAGPRKPLPDPLLQRAADLSLTAELINAPLQPDAQLPDVWIGSWRFRETPSGPPADPLKQLEQLQQNLQPPVKK